MNISFKLLSFALVLFFLFFYYIGHAGATVISDEILGQTMITSSLRVGMRGNDVKKLQTFLSVFPDVYPEKLVTGYFGRLTEIAVKRFQKAHGIEQIGIVGPKTRAKLNLLFALPVPPIQFPPLPIPPGTTTPPIPTPEPPVPAPTPVPPPPAPTSTPTTVVPPPTTSPGSSLVWQISKVTDSQSQASTPSLAWSGTEYGMVWTDNTGGGEPGIYFGRLDGAGTKIGTIIKLSESKNISANPKILWNGSEFAVLWADHSRYASENETKGCGMHFARIQQNGLRIDVYSRILSDTYGTCPTNPALLWNGTDYGVFWDESRASTQTSRVFFAALDLTGNVKGSEVQVTSVPSTFGSAAWNGTEYVLLWNTPTDQGPLRLLDKNGVKVGNDMPLDTGSAYITSTIGWGIASDGEGYGIFFQGTDERLLKQQYFMRTNKTGTTTAKAVLLTTNTATDIMLPGKALWANNSFAAVLAADQSHSYFLTINKDGVFIKSPTQMDPGNGRALHPSFIWNGAFYAAAWDNYDIYFAAKNP